jgi:uncharacterized repeat protein (TIGR01451 family)
VTGDRVSSRFLVLLGAILLISATVLVAIAPAALAVPPGSAVFQLEGDALDNGAGDDWENVENGNDSAVASFFETDAAGRRFTEGSKDTLDMPSNSWDTQNVPDKDDILHAYAAFYGGGSPVITFGLDRYANNGDANVGFWFFQDDVGLGGGGSFTGNRTVNDLFVVSEFDQGGDVSTIVVYRWTGSGVTLEETGAVCVPGGSQQDVCAIANTDDETAPWSYTPKFGDPGTFPEGSFFEGGVDLDEIFPSGAPCFSTFMAETRASTETTAELKNFVLGNFDTCGTVTIVKDAVPNDGQDFTFGGDFGNFSLDDDGNATLPNEITLDDVDPGTYQVSETNIPSDWQLVEIDCDDTDSEGDVGTATATIHVAEAEHVTCTFTNEEDGKIIVVKETDPADSPQLFEFDSNYGSNFFLQDGQSMDSGFLDPGDGYSVVELTPAGWDLTNVSCDDGSDNTNIDLDPGETVTCTFSNRQDGKIIVVKRTDPDGDPQVFDFDASYDADGFSLSDGQSNDSGFIDPGSYSVSEDVPVGWDLTSATCNDGSDPSAIDLDAGEIVTCTFNNTERGTILVDKVTDPSGHSQTFDFSASWDGGVDPDFSLADLSPLATSGFIMPGTYWVSETVPAGWDLTSATCNDGSAPSAIDLDAGETVTCTFNNAIQRGTIIVEKVTVPADGEDFVFTGDAAGTLDDGESIIVSDLLPGQYTSTEVDPGPEWVLGAIQCDDANSDGDVPSATATFNVEPGETVTCTFTNTARGTITVIKEVLNAGDQTEFDYTSDYGDPFSLGEGDANQSDLLDVGNYSVGETVPDGWDLVSVDCQGTGGSSGTADGTAANITLTDGGTVTCVFTNARPSIQIVKTAGDAANGEDYVFEGGSVTYHYLVTNIGPIPLNDVTVVDNMGTPGNDSDDVVVSCPSTTLAAGASMECELVVNVTTPGTTTNVATAGGTSEGGNEVEDDDEAVVVVPLFFGLLIDKSNDAPLVGSLELPTVEEGDTITYTLDYTVDTNDVVTNAVITDALPEGLTYAPVPGASSDSQFTFQGFVDDPDPDSDADSISGTLIWTASEVTIDGTLTYQATADEGSAELPQPLVNVAVISSDQTEPDNAESEVFVSAPPQALTPPPTDAIGDRTPATGGMPLPAILLLLGGITLLVGLVPLAPARVRRRRGQGS